MDSSEAPVYVVVKSFAASMAANIATQAKKSFTYPNAVILHHQILQAQYGNLTQQRESVKYMEQWWHRLAEAGREKMGVTLDEFIRKCTSTSRPATGRSSATAPRSCTGSTPSWNASRKPRSSAIRRRAARRRRTGQAADRGRSPTRMKET